MVGKPQRVDPLINHCQGKRSQGDSFSQSDLPACRLSACSAQAGAGLGAARAEALLFFQDLDLGPSRPKLG